MKFRCCVLTQVLFLALVAWAQADSLSQTKAMTPEQAEKMHAKLIQVGSPGQIQEQLAHTQGDVHLRTGTAHEQGIGLPMAWQLANLSCQSDLVIVGKAIQGISYPTADQGYIYTEWKFAIEQVLQPNPKSSARAGTTVSVIRPGGMIEFDGRKVYAELDYFPDFKPGQHLLLYVRFIPQTGAYSLRQPNVFPVSDNNLQLAHAGVKSAAADSHCGESHQ